MKVLLSWLQEFAPVSGDSGEIGDQLSELGLAVEAVTTVGAGLDGVVVARVLELRPHPDADRIQLVDVDAGDGEALQICCGAFNMSVGDLVPLATLGCESTHGRHQNCDRKRWSLRNSSRRSSIPWRMSARRSRPNPKAKPDHSSGSKPHAASTLG